VRLVVKVVPLQKVTKVVKAVQVTINRIDYKVINVGQADHYAEKYGITEFSLENLYINGLIGQNDLIKVLGNGEIKGKFSFKVNAVSEKAKAAIEAAGGTVEIVK